MSAERTLQLLDDRLALRLRCIDLKSVLDTLPVFAEDHTTQGLRQLYARELVLIEHQLGMIGEELRMMGIELEEDRLEFLWDGATPVGTRKVARPSAAAAPDAPPPEPACRRIGPLS
jgi:hypothetical protein